MRKNAIDELMEQVDALCRIFVGDHAPSEPWPDTCRRLIEIDKTLRRARRQRILETRKEEATA